MEIKDEGFFIIRSYPKKNAVTISLIIWEMDDNAYYVKTYCRIGVDYVGHVASSGPFAKFEEAKDDLNTANTDWHESAISQDISSGALDHRKQIESMTKFDWAEHRENQKRREEAEKVAKKKAKKHQYYLQRKERIARGEPTNPRAIPGWEYGPPLEPPV